MLLSALALMLVFEGLLPLLSPGTWRRMFLAAAKLNDGQLRFIGLVSVAAGGLLLLLFSA